ncbi:MAG: hypothetical protein QOC81_3354 [Thermoanaerobaculia bacterium]|jgi:hypothetical protein|nr:hypothetical protein [Thermoanaerobaculia bacterium]
MVIVKVARDARTGRFTTFVEARRHPQTTVVETVKRRSPKSRRTR